MSQRTRAAGFSLLEVMVAIAILALSMGVIMEIEGHAIVKTNDAKAYTVATLLARGKILDVQQELEEDGYGDFMKVLDGDFEEEGFPDFRWAARVRKVEIPIPGSMPGEAGGRTAEGSGGMALGSLTPMLQSFSKVFEDAVREIEVQVLWSEGPYEQHVSVVTHIVSRELLRGGLSGAGLPAGMPGGVGMPGAPSGGKGSPSPSPTPSPRGGGGGGMPPAGTLK